MYGISFNPNWTFKEAVGNLKALKTRYEQVLVSFSCYEVKERVEFRRHTRNAVYSIQAEEWERDKIWEYMNGYEFLYVLAGMARRRKK